MLQLDGERKEGAEYRVFEGRVNMTYLGVTVDLASYVAISNGNYNEVIGFKDGDGTNCKYDNLLFKVPKRSKKSSSIYKGVRKNGTKYQARLDGKSLGHFAIDIQAAIAYDDAVVAKYGAESVVNFSTLDQLKLAIMELKL